MKFSSICFCAVLIFGWCSFAQFMPVIEPADEEEAPPVADPDPPMAGIEPPAPLMPRSDEIHLKSGAVLRDVQVLRRSPLGFEVQVTPDVTFFLPRRQVAEIKYDDTEPVQEHPPLPAPRHSTLFGAKLEPATFEKLNAPLPDSCLNSLNRCIVDMMELISEETGVQIEVDDAVAAIPEEERLWDFSLEPGTTLITLLQSNLPERFPDLVIAYQYDTLIITTRDDADAQDDNDNGGADPELPPAFAPFNID